MTGGAAEKKSPVAFIVVVLAIAILPFFGHGGLLAAAILALALLGEPLFVIIGLATVLCFLLWTDVAGLVSFSPLIERIRSLADSATLLAIPLFIMSGAVMSKGQISVRLIEFSRALIGWIPGGLAISAVLACMLFAAISGSSPATVVAIGAMMGPALIDANYKPRFAHGLLASAGSLGILIPPSIPMIIYPIVNQDSGVKVEELFASGFGPGIVMGGILMGFSIYRGVIDKAPRQKFELGKLKTALLDGFWALAFPVLILGGIYTGTFNAIEASAISVIYAVIVEVYIHRAIKLSAVPKIFQETGIFLGSLLVIMVAALVLAEFLEGQGIPEAAVRWVESLDLQPWMFLVALNILLLLVGAMMDILSAMFIFVPLLAPVAVEMGVDPMHFGIIFIVNLEIGYLTPPVGLNLFVASALFEKPIGHVIRSVLPFIGLMILGLGVITYVPAVSVGLGRWIMGSEPPVEAPEIPGGELENTGSTGDGDDTEQPLDELVAEVRRIVEEGGLSMAAARRESLVRCAIQERLDRMQAQLDELVEQGEGDGERAQTLRGDLERYAEEGSDAMGMTCIGHEADEDGSDAEPFEPPLDGEEVEGDDGDLGGLPEMGGDVSF